MDQSHGQTAALVVDISVQLAEKFDAAGELNLLGPVSGGDINRAFQATYGARRLFIKFNHPGCAGMFESEFTSLLALRDAGCLRAPEPYCHGCNQHSAWLVMEHIELHPRGDATALGQGLAMMHRTAGRQFGWCEDNFIGATPQLNTRSEDWPQFWWEQRINFQLSLASQRGRSGRLTEFSEQIQPLLQNLFHGHAPVPSLLHGDLWGGNFGYDHHGRPVVLDPACYYGDRETDLAMTELFGGFPPDFYQAYNEAWPLDEGYRKRRKLYQLYHVINHLNLFGSGWLGRAESLAESLIHELR